MGTRKLFVIGVAALSLVLSGCNNQNAPITPTYTVTWKNYDGTILEEDENVAEGEMPHYDGNTPTKEEDENYTYTFDGWTPELDKVKSNITYTATFKSEDKPYLINWYNYNGSLLYSEKVPEGTTPTYKGEAPTKPADEEYTYTFSGWEPEVVPATTNADYTAVFTRKEIEKYTITWLNYDGSVLVITTVKEGEVPVYPNSDPERPDEVDCTYTFAGWDSITPAYSDATYTACYIKNEKAKYTVTWENYDGSVLKQEVYHEGEMPEYNDDDPIRDNDEEYKYDFVEWIPQIEVVTKDAIYTASYEPIPLKTLTATWKNYDGAVLYSCTFKEGKNIPQYAGDTPTKPEDEQNTYAFDSWDENIDETGNITYTATYVKTEKEKYQIVWKDYDGTVLLENICYEGNIPAYEGETPTREDDDDYRYTFDGWTPELEACTGGTTYTATYSSSTKFTITWKNYDGTVLLENKCVEGEVPQYTGETPTKPEDEDYTYTFNSWSPTVEEADKDATYTATYSSSAKPINYEVTEAVFNNAADYMTYIASMDSLNFTAVSIQTKGENVSTYSTKYDNGKILAENDYGDFYVDIKEGSYDSTTHYWGFDYYYYEDDQWNKISRESDGLPDDMIYPSLSFFGEYRDFEFDENNNCYVLKAEEVVKNLHEHYYDFQVVFNNNKLVSYSYEWYRDSTPTEIHIVQYNFSAFGTTEVEFPDFE